MPDLAIGQVNKGALAPPLPTSRPLISDDVVAKIKDALKDEGPYASGHASVNAIEDINDAVASASKKVLNEVLSKLSDKQLTEFMDDIYSKSTGLNASERKHLNGMLAKKLDAKQYQRFVEPLGKQDKKELKELTDQRFQTESGRWDFQKLSKAYQGKDEMLSDLSFNKWNLDAINSAQGGTCATRLSNALNRAGYRATMDQAHLNTKMSTMGGKNRVSGEEHRYVMGAHKLATHLGVVKNGKIVSDISD
jgi:hypothetical protein